jgi:GxxExxY protein
MRMDGEPVEKALTDAILHGCYAVFGALGTGFVEKVYENALAIELRASGLTVGQQAPLTVRYKGQVVGEYFADLIVNERVIVELKAQDNIAPVHEIQLVNYLEATGLQVGLLVNFGRRMQIRRKINSHPPRPSAPSASSASSALKS